MGIACVNGYFSSPHSLLPIAHSLSERENQVLTLVAEGLTNTQVAQRLHVSANTVKFHLKNIYEQLNVTNRTEASRWYLENRD